MKGNFPVTISRKHVVGLIVLFSLLLVAGGYFYYKYKTREIRQEKHQDLATIAKMKAGQINQWRKERMSEVKFFSTDPFFIDNSEELIRKTIRNSPRFQMIERLSHIKSRHGYRNIFIVTKEYEKIFSLLSASIAQTGPLTEQYVDSVFAGKHIQTTGLYKNPLDDHIYMDFIAPLKNDDGRVMAAMVFRTNPYSYLYPLIQSWPAESRTSETMLVRRNGDSVLFLNELRHKKYTALNYQISLQKKKVAAVRAVGGYQGIWEGPDYRGEKVLAHTQPIDGTSWFMIAKVDKDEIYTTLANEMIYIILFVGLGILFVAAAVSFFYSYQQKNVYRQLFHSQKEYHTTLQSIGDAVIATDHKGNVQYLNPVAEKLTGWSESLARERKLEDVFKIINENSREKVVSPVRKVLEKGIIIGLANHTLLISKSGKEIPITDSGAPIRDTQGNIKGVVLVFRDQTREREQNKILKESEKKYKYLFENNPVPMWIYDLESLKFLMVNNAAVHNYGYSRDEFLSMTIKDIRPAEDIEALKKDVEGTTGFYNKAGIWRHTQKSGKIIHVEINSHLIEFNNRKARLVLASYVSERVQVEKIQQIHYNIAHAVVTSESLDKLYHIIEQELSTLISTKNFIIALYDDKTNMLFSPYHKDEMDELPPQWEAGNSLTGYCLRQKKSVLVGAEEINRLAEAGEIEIIGTIPEVWLGVPLKTGERVIGVMIFQNYHDPHAYNNNSLKVIGSIANQLSVYIQNKRKENEVQESEKKYRTIFNESPVGIFYFDKQGIIRECNSKFEDIIGSSRNLLIGLNMPVQLKDEKLIDAVRQTLTEGSSYYEDWYKSVTADKVTYFKILFKGILNEKNEITMGLGLVEDITERKRAEEDLVQAKEKAEEGNRLKTAFLANMNHEIRTPMNGILGFTDLLKDPELTSEQQWHHIQMIEKSGHRMLNTVNDLIDISKIEAGQVQVTYHSTHVNKHLDELFRFFEPEAKAKGIAFTLQKGLADSEAIISTDKHKLDSILTNLIKNAIKYTSSGRIDIGYKRRKNILDFYVEDTGIGIPEDRQEAVFDRFVQADLSDKKAFQGSGLGLSITKAYVEMLGGAISMESQEDQGSRFSFTLPYKTPDERDKGSLQEEHILNPQKGNGRKMEILIVDDDDASALYLAELFKNESHKLLYANTGLEALKTVQNNPDLDLVFMDIKIPEMNGYEVTRKIREFNEEVVIIAQTAYAMKGDREKSIQAGCDDYLPKPIKRIEVQRVINKHLSAS
ncbi:MAG: PAS domain S-box protein [Bacteroidales bacterium]|nr:PAS domain S-box protein [Bacteroidales bacterium]MCF8332798.1 PAS domain S-box protein [Bacteroidales bacterium]